MNTDTRHLRIRGRVQGVGYRLYTLRQASRLGVTGWVRNREDGSVEAVVQGEPGRVETLMERLRKGPPASRVEEIEVDRLPDSGPLEGFEIKR